MRRDEQWYMSAVAVTLRLLFLFALSGCALKAAFKHVDLPPGGREVQDVVYWQGDAFNEDKHKLDIYSPATPGPHPVIVFVHGGGWRLGDRRQRFNNYVKLGRRLAGRDVVAVIISYRLAPHFKHPAQVRDVARALAWTMKHIAENGGDPDAVFAMGHSAGAQLVALAGCDKRWLEEEGESPSKLKGVIGVSGPYDIAHLGRSLFIGGFTMVMPAFGQDAGVWTDASPATHLHEEKPPPFFVAWADGDFEIIRRDSKRFADELEEAGVPVETFQTTFDDHFSVITNFADEGDPLAEQVLQFVKGAP
jgi:acetyl esterase/lipase